MTNAITLMTAPDMRTYWLEPEAPICSAKNSTCTPVNQTKPKITPSRFCTRKPSCRISAILLTATASENSSMTGTVSVAKKMTALDAVLRKLPSVIYSQPPDETKNSAVTAKNGRKKMPIPPQIIMP